MNQKPKLFLLIAAMGLAVSGCGDKKPEAVSTGKAAVSVNGQSILDAEIQTKYAMRDDGDGKTKPVSEQAMESLVNMELMRQAAIQSKLDGDEKTQAKIANSMRSILAMAYMEQLLESVNKPTDAEVSAYYAEHPERYSARKQYAMQEIQIRATPDGAKAILDQLGKLNSVDLFEKWLNENKIAHQTTPISVMTDGMPEDVLEKFKNSSVGNFIVLDDKEPMRILFIMQHHYFTTKALRQFLFHIRILLRYYFFMIKEIVTGHPHSFQERSAGVVNGLYVIYYEHSYLK